MRYLPVFMDLKRQAVLLVGGGKVAERKIRLLLRAGAVVHVVARHLTENVEAWKRSGEVIHIANSWQADQLDGMRLVYAATSDSRLNREVFAAAEKLGIAANVVDDPEFSRFISPAIVDRSPVQVAITTGGSAPVLARRIRGWIESLLPHGMGQSRAGRWLPEAAGEAQIAAGGKAGFLGDPVQQYPTSGLEQRLRNPITADMESALGKSQLQNSGGKVYLVGAGPGRVDLLTLRALEVLGQADVVLHDRLVPEEILEMARRDAERIYVGKQAGNHHRSQREIHEILLNEAGKGRTVVRLKGGDPFVFGRGGEELELLRSHGVEYEVVPGITAATGCAAYSGIPLTHRDHAQVLTFVTGHLSSSGAPDAIDWFAIAGPGRTTVIYMGGGAGRHHS